jgi:hypothetical protein
VAQAQDRAIDQRVASDEANSRSDDQAVARFQALLAIRVRRACPRRSRQAPPRARGPVELDDYRRLGLEPDELWSDVDARR